MRTAYVKRMLNVLVKHRKLKKQSAHSVIGKVKKNQEIWIFVNAKKSLLSRTADKTDIVTNIWYVGEYSTAAA